MPSVTALMLNGTAYSYRDIRYGGMPQLRVIRPYIRSIGFTNASEGALNHGHSPLGRKASGAYSPTLEWEMAEEGVALLMKLLPAQGYDQFPIGMFEISYAKAQTIPPFKRVRFRNVHILGTSASWSQGTTELSRRVPTIVQAIEEDHGDGIWRCPINLAAEELGV